MNNILGELEQKVMDILWASNEPMKPAEVLNELSDDLAYTTVMTILKRLSDKNLLTRKKIGKVYFYEPQTAKSKFAEGKLSKLFKSIVDSYGKIAISQFIDSIKSSPDDLDILKEYLEETSETKK